MKICPKCSLEHNEPGNFCSRKCANSRKFSTESELKTSTTLKEKYFNNKLVTQIATLRDLPAIESIIRSNDKMYGVDLSEYYDGIIGVYHKSINSDDATVMHCSDDGEIVGVMLQRFWKELPFWTAGNQFINKDIWTNTMFTKTIHICRNLSDFASNYAEGRNTYDYVSVIRGDDQNRRNVKFSSNKFLTEYNHYIWKTIMPGETSDNPLYQRLLGYTYGKTTKPIMIRHSSMKPEYRK